MTGSKIICRRAATSRTGEPIGRAGRDSSGALSAANACIPSLHSRSLGTARAGMRRLYAASIVIATLSLAIPIAASAADSLTVQDRILPDQVHLYGRFHIQPPAGCPPVEPPTSASLSKFTTYYSSQCSYYRMQTADVSLVVTHYGRVIYHESVTVFPATNPQAGGVFDTSIYRFEIGNTCGGVIYWRVTLSDPYFRSSFGASRSGSFTAPCR